MISKQEVINTAKNKYSFLNLSDEQAYKIGAQEMQGKDIESWDDAYKPSQSKKETSPGFVNSLWEMGDYGVDENSADWLKSSYNNSLTGKAEEMITGKPKYNLEDYNPGFLEDIGSTVVSFLYPIDAITMMFGGFLGKGASKAYTATTATKVSKVLNVTKKLEDGTSVAHPVAIKAVEGMFTSAGTLAAYEGAMGATQASIEGKDTAGILSAAGYGVVHGGAMGAMIGLTGGGMGAAHAGLKAGTIGQTYSEGAKKALSAATSLPSAVAAEASIFAAPQMLDLATNGIVDEKGNIRDARLNDYVKTWVENAALIGVLKAQGKVTSKIFKDGEKTIEQIKKSYDKTKDKAQNDAYADLLSRTEKDVDIPESTKMQIRQKQLELENKIERELGIERSELEKTFRLGKKSFEKDLTKNPELIISRFQFIRTVAESASELARKSQGKDKATFEIIADTFIKEMNKGNEAVSGLKQVGGKIVAVEKPIAEPVVETAKKPAKAPVKVGDMVQWTSQGVDQFKKPRKIKTIEETATGEKFATFEGEKAGAPYSELARVKPVKKAPKLKTQELREQAQVKVKDLEVKLQEQIKTDKAKEQQILQKANQADVSRYNALESQRQKGTLDKKGSRQLGYLRKKLFKQGPIDSPQVKSLMSQIKAEQKAITGLDRTIALLKTPTKKTLAALKTITKEKHDVMRTRPEITGNIVNLEAKATYINKKNVSQARESLIGTDNLYRMTKPQLEIYADYLSKSENYKGKNLKERVAIYEAYEADAMSTASLKKRVKQAEDFGAKKGEGFAGIKDINKLRDYSAMLRSWERTKNIESMSYEIFAKRDQKMKYPFLGSLVIPVHKMVEKISPRLSNKLNSHLSTVTGYEGAFGYAGKQIKDRLGKFKDSLFLIDKERKKDREKEGLLTATDKEFLKLSKDKNSDVYKGVQQYKLLTKEIYDTVYRTMINHQYINAKQFSKDFNRMKVTDYFTRRVTKEFLKDWRQSPEIETYINKRVDKAVEAEMKKKGKKRTEAEIRREQEQLIFDYIDAPIGEMSSSYFKERSLKLPEVVTIDGKKVQTYETSFLSTVDPYILNTSKFIATLQHFPEFTQMGKKYKVKGSTKAELLNKISSNQEFGLFAKQAIEREIGLDYRRSDILNRKLLKFGSAVTNIGAAIGLSSPTSGIKNLILGTRMVGHFGLVNSVNGYRQIFKESKRIEAREKGAMDFQSRTLDLQSQRLGDVVKPLEKITGPISLGRIFTWNLMQQTENLNRAAAMFAGRAYFSDITKSLRGEKFHVLKGLSAAKAERAMKEIFQLTEGEIQFLRSQKTLEKLNIDGRERMDIIKQKVDTFSHVSTQGGTQPSRLPMWMGEQYSKPFTLFTRIATTITYDTYNNIVKPMYTHGNFAPFVATTVSSYLGGAALFGLYEGLFGLKKPAKPNDFLDEAVANLHRAEYLGMFTELLNPYESNEGMPNPISEPIIIRYANDALTNLKAWYAGSKNLGQAADDFAKKTIVIYGQARKGFDYQVRDKTGLQGDTKKIQTLVRKWQNETNRKTGTGGNSGKRKPYYRTLKDQFYFGSEEDFARAYWATYNYIATKLMKDRFYNPRTRAGAKRLHKETKAAIQSSMRNYKPISLNDEGDGVIMNKTELNQFKAWLGNDKESLELLERSMKSYEFRKRKLEREIPKYFRSESVMSGFVSRY